MPSKIGHYFRKDLTYAAKFFLSKLRLYLGVSYFDQHFFLFQVTPLPMQIYGAKMVTTSQGNGLVMTHFRDVYMFKCKSESNCEWFKEPYSLKVSRVYHEMLSVPTSFLENC